METFKKMFSTMGATRLRMFVANVLTMFINTELIDITRPPFAESNNLVLEQKSKMIKPSKNIACPIPLHDLFTLINFILK